MKTAELVFQKRFQGHTRQRSNPGVKAANLFWPKVVAFIEGSDPGVDLVNDRVLKEHFAIGYAASSLLNYACRKATQIKVIHHLDSRNLPAIKALFFMEGQLYEFVVTFCRETGKPLYVSRMLQGPLGLAA
jgi:hypothetical protein